MKKILLSLLASLLLGAPTQAAILNNGIVPGFENSLNDNNVDRYIPVGGLPGSDFAVGDVFQSLLLFEQLNGINLPTAVGVADYQLSAIASLTITDVTPAQSGFPGAVDLKLSGTVDIYETAILAQHADFLTDWNTAEAAILSQTLILSVATDFYEQLNAPENVTGLPTGQSNALTADAGFSITANPGNLNIVPDGTNKNYVPIGVPPGGPYFPIDSFHDVGGNIQLYANTGGGISQTEFPLISNTTVAFLAAEAVVPEPTSLVVWAGIGLLLSTATKRKNRS